MSHKQTTAFCAGTFDPVTVGHTDIFERASKLCDTLVIGVMRNLAKQSMFTEDQRMEMVRAAVAHIPNAVVTGFDGHMATYVLENEFDFVVRGLRNAGDFNYEIQLAQLYAKFYNGKADTIYLMTDPRYSYISSSIVRENFILGADVSEWVGDKVYELMRSYISKV